VGRVSGDGDGCLVRLQGWTPIGQSVAGAGASPSQRDETAVVGSAAGVGGARGDRQLRRRAGLDRRTGSRSKPTPLRLEMPCGCDQNFRKAAATISGTQRDRKGGGHDTSNVL